MFGEKLKSLMKEQKLTQKQVCEITGIGSSSISQYLSGLHEPSKVRQVEMAQALGVEEDYFTDDLPKIRVSNLPVRDAARIMHKSPEWICKGLQDGVFPWGYAVKMKDWSYFISAIKFAESLGIPIKEVDNED